MKALWAWLRNEPVTVIAGAVSAALEVLVAFHIHVTTEQRAAIMGAIPLVFALIARQTVTPTAKAPDADAFSDEIAAKVAAHVTPLIPPRAMPAVTATTSTASGSHIPTAHYYEPDLARILEWPLITAPVEKRLELLPAPGPRKGGLLPSVRDDRDWQAKIPRIASIPSSVDYGAGIDFAMLLNDRLGDCYEAAALHAIQILTGGAFVPTDADALVMYEQVTGYDPRNPNSDQGTAGRPLYKWLKANGLITSYAAVPPNRAAVKAAIATYKAVLCEWALPVGAENEGDHWTMPRTGRQAGSWGGHATVECGYTSRVNRNVTWGEYGTVTPAFEDAYLQAAWVIAVPDKIPAFA